MSKKCLHDVGGGWCNRFSCWCNAYCSDPVKCRAFIPKARTLPEDQRTLFPHTTPLS